MVCGLTVRLDQDLKSEPRDMHVIYHDIMHNFLFGRPNNDTIASLEGWGSEHVSFGSIGGNHSFLPYCSSTSAGAYLEISLRNFLSGIRLFLTKISLSLP